MIKTIATINQIEILLLEEGEKRIPIKPICELLGIDYSTQLKKIKSDDILSSTMGLRPIVAADKKEREMATIPFKYVFGWLFTINLKNVSEEARPLVLRYKLACYDALYYHFTAHSEFLEVKQQALELKLNEIQGLKEHFSTAKSKLTEAQKELKEIRDLSFEDWDAKKRQLSLDI